MPFRLFSLRPMLVFITDLDGTLLDDAYSWEPASPALNLLKQRGIPLVLCTSKTRAEVDPIRQRLGSPDPFIVENGGALYIPDGALPLKLHAPARRNRCSVIELGSPYSSLIQSLRQAAEESKCTVRGFHQMSLEEIGACCRMPPELAKLARQREYDEPFKILHGNPPDLLAAIEKQKMRWTRGGCFYHILGANDKAHCVNLLIHYYRTVFDSVITVGLGDGLNDAGFLRLVDYPLILQSPSSMELMKAVPRGRLCAGNSGPEAWNAAVMDTLNRLLPEPLSRPED